MNPLTPTDCNLQDSKYMPIYVQQMLNSSFNAMSDDTAWRAGVTLWMKAWHQVPAASLPNDEDELCALAGLGRDMRTWKKIRAKALRGWIECDDCRIYHPVVAEAALEAWVGALLSRISSGEGNAKRWGGEFDRAPLDDALDCSIGLLRALNPRADAVLKVDRRNAKDKRPQSQTHPGGITSGHRSGVPHQSQSEPEPECEVVKEAAVVSASAKTDAQEVLAELQAVPGLHRAEWQGHTANIVIGWLNNGFDPQSDILPAVRARVAKLKHQPRSWEFFTESVAQAYANRTRAIPIPDAQAPPSVDPWDIAIHNITGGQAA